MHAKVGETCATFSKVCQLLPFPRLWATFSKALGCTGLALFHGLWACLFQGLCCFLFQGIAATELLVLGQLVQVVQHSLSKGGPKLALVLGLGVCNAISIQPPTAWPLWWSQADHQRSLCSPSGMPSRLCHLPPAGWRWPCWWTACHTGAASSCPWGLASFCCHCPQSWSGGLLPPAAGMSKLPCCQLRHHHPFPRCCANPHRCGWPPLPLPFPRLSLPFPRPHQADQPGACSAWGQLACCCCWPQYQQQIWPFPRLLAALPCNCLSFSKEACNFALSCLSFSKVSAETREAFLGPCFPGLPFSKGSASTLTSSMSTSFSKDSFSKDCLAFFCFFMAFLCACSAFFQGFVLLSMLELVQALFSGCFQASQVLFQALLPRRVVPLPGRDHCLASLASFLFWEVVPEPDGLHLLLNPPGGVVPSLPFPRQLFQALHSKGLRQKFDVWVCGCLAYCIQCCGRFLVS